MAFWRGDGEEPPAQFLDLLFADEEEEVAMESDEEIDDEDLVEEPQSCLPHHSSPERWQGSPQLSEASEISLEAPPYSPMTSPERREELPPVEEQAPRQSRDRSRSRSRSPLHVVLAIYDEDGVPMDPVNEDEFLDPDTHSIYVERERDVRNRRGTRDQRVGRRGGRRGAGGRGQSAPNRGRRGGRQWEVGHPLDEIWSKDEDVPPQLMEMVRDLLRKRQLRERNARNGSESEDDDEFFEASDGSETLHRLEGQNLGFDWSTTETFQGEEEQFIPERTGSVHDLDSPYDAFGPIGTTTS